MGHITMFVIISGQGLPKRGRVRNGWALSSIFRTENRKPAMLTILEKYEREILPTKAKGTIKDQKHHLQILKEVDENGTNSNKAKAYSAIPGAGFI